MSDHHHKDDNSNFSLFITGLAVGAAVTYMFTTKSGQKIKEELLREAEKMLKGVGDEFEKAKDKIEDEGEKLLEDVKEKKKQRDEDVQNTAKQVKKEASEVVSQAAGAIEDVPQEVQEIQKKGRRFFFSKKSTSSES